MQIEINGVKYQEKKQPKRKPMSKTVAAMLMMASGFSYLDPDVIRPKNTTQVDFIKEYELIQLKKSNLSRSERERVIWLFNKYFEKI